MANLSLADYWDLASDSGLASFLCTPAYYLEMPGSSEDIRQVMRVNQKNDEASGSYDFVTVAVKQATSLMIVYAGQLLLQISTLKKK